VGRGRLRPDRYPRSGRPRWVHARDAGCDPRTGERLKPEHGRRKVAAFDLTFSAPESVRVLFAIADEAVSTDLLEAHERAVAEAFAYIEREACFTRRGRNGAFRVRGEGFIAAAYRHRLSRAGDPQLHTHVVVANMTRADGRWTSLEAHALYEHKSAARAVYRRFFGRRFGNVCAGCGGGPWVVGCSRSTARPGGLAGVLAPARRDRGARPGAHRGSGIAALTGSATGDRIGDA